MTQPSTLALIIGGSRGIGAATAERLARDGHEIIVTYVKHQRRADRVVARIVADGGVAEALQLDICATDAVGQLARRLEKEGQRLAVLVLSASGGLEMNKPPDYAEAINVDAQECLINHLLTLMERGGRIVYLTSHEAHFSDRVPPMTRYISVAISKRRGETLLRTREPDFVRAGVAFLVLSVDLVEGTATAKMLELVEPGTASRRRELVSRLPEPQDVAQAVALFCVGHRSPGLYTEFVWEPGLAFISTPVETKSYDDHSATSLKSFGANDVNRDNS